MPFLKRPQWSAGTATAVSAPGVKAPLGGRSLGRIKMQAPGAPTTPLAQSGRMPRRVRRPGRSTGPKTTWAALRRRQAHVVRLVYGAECVHGGAQDRRQHTSLPEEWPVLQLVHGETSAGHGKINPERAPRESKICGMRRHSTHTCFRSERVARRWGTRAGSAEVRATAAGSHLR